MALGDTGLLDFKPKGSSTAAKLLTTMAPLKQDTKKTERTEFRIRSDIKLLFEEICAEHGTDVSSAIRAYIEDTVNTGRLKNATDFSDLSVQSVRTNENGPLTKTSLGFAACGELNLRNKEERERWLNNFRNWSVWLDVPEVNKTFYRFNLKNGCAIIVEVGVEYMDAYSSVRGKTHERVTFSIIDNEHTQFNSQGDSFTMVIQWLTKYSKDI